MCWNSVLANRIITSIRYMKFISAILNLYRRFSNYIDRFLIYISYFSNISTYRQKNNKIKRAHTFKCGLPPITYLPKNGVTVLILVLNSFRLYGVRIRFCPRQIWVGFLDYKYATRPFLL